MKTFWPVVSNSRICNGSVIKKNPKKRYFIYRLLHIDEQRLDGWLEPIYNSSVSIQDIAFKASRERWTIETGGERKSGRSMLAPRHHDENSLSAESKNYYQTKISLLPDAKNQSITVGNNFSFLLTENELGVRDE